VKKMVLTMRVEVPLDESMLDVAGFRSLWEEIDGLCDSARGIGEVVGFRVDDLPDSIVLADTRHDAVLMAHLRAAQRDGGS
jgi:hypothetical protein